MKDEASDKPSLRFLNTSSFSIGHTHPVWDTLSSNPREVTKASIKARILTGTYVLQANRAKFNQFEVNPTCLMCSAEAEDRIHFILRCKVLESSRKFYLNKLKCCLLQHYTEETVVKILNDEQILFQLIMDSTHPKLHCIDTDFAKLSWEIEPIARSLCYCLHTRRSAIMVDISSQKN